jgi:hypothetical protein
VSQSDSFHAALKAGDDAHLLTVGSPTRGLAFRVTLGRLSRAGRWHGWQPCAFFIWRGRRIG